MVPDTVKMPAPEVFNGEHDGETIRAFFNACKTFFKLTGVSDVKMQALFTKARLAHTARTWYDSQGYDENTLTFAVLCAHMLAYFVPSDFVRRAHRNLVASHMGGCTTTDYIDDFCRCLVSCRDVHEIKAKFIFETNMTHRISALVLPYDCPMLHETMLCTECIGSIQ